MGTTKRTMFTPGPWEVYDHAPWSVWHGQTQIAACRVIEIKGEDRWIASYFERDDERAAANARLIAAAPAMYTELQRFNDEAGYEDWNDVAFIKRVRALLAQIDGEA